MFIAEYGTGEDWDVPGKKAVLNAGSFDVQFESAPAVLVRLRIKDHDGKSERDGLPVMAALTFTDSSGRSDKWAASCRGRKSGPGR